MNSGVRHGIPRSFRRFNISVLMSFEHQKKIRVGKQLIGKKYRVNKRAGKMRELLQTTRKHIDNYNRLKWLCDRLK